MLESPLSGLTTFDNLSVQILQDEASVAPQKPCDLQLMHFRCKGSSSMASLLGILRPDVLSPCAMRHRFLQRCVECVAAVAHGNSPDGDFLGIETLYSS